MPSYKSQLTFTVPEGVDLQQAITAIEDAINDTSDEIVSDYQIFGIEEGD